MFGRQRNENENQETAQRQETVSPAARAAEHQHAPRAAAPARRVVEMPANNSRRSSSSNNEEKILKVGKGLSLAGEITSCDILVVEGKVEAKLTEGKLLEITEHGQFRGSVEIENADIAGRFDGNLTVRGRLTVRSSGRISGMVKYGELEVNAGGQIIGEVQVTGGGASQQSGNGFKSAARYAALGENENGTEEQTEERKSA